MSFFLGYEHVFGHAADKFGADACTRNEEQVSVLLSNLQNGPGLILGTTYKIPIQKES
jgi:hypothetical protein